MNRRSFLGSMTKLIGISLAVPAVAEALTPVDRFEPAYDWVVGTLGPFETIESANRQMAEAAQRQYGNMTRNEKLAWDLINNGFTDKRRIQGFGTLAHKAEGTPIH